MRMSSSLEKIIRHERSILTFITLPKSFRPSRILRIFIILESRIVYFNVFARFTRFLDFIMDALVLIGFE